MKRVITSILVFLFVCALCACALLRLFFNENASAAQAPDAASSSASSGVISSIRPQDDTQ